MRTHLAAAVAMIALLALYMLVLGVLEPAAQTYNESPLNWKNSPLNYDNSPLNYRNSPLNYQNSPLNPASPQLRDPATGQSEGYVVPRPDGGINVYSPSGEWVGTVPGR